MLFFGVESSSGDREYVVLAVPAGDQVRMSWECDSAENGMHCSTVSIFPWGHQRSRSSPAAIPLT
ncbi:hypothetical protein ACVWW1_008886 [Bradyrhizobium sp. JR3.5]